MGKRWETGHVCKKTDACGKRGSQGLDRWIGASNLCIPPRIPTSYIIPSETTSSNDGLNCLNVTSPFPPPPPSTTSTTSTSTTTTTTTITTTTTTTIPKVRCHSSTRVGVWMLFHLLKKDMDSWPCISHTPGGPNGQGDWQLDNAAVGSLEATWAPLSPRILNPTWDPPQKSIWYMGVSKNNTPKSSIKK